MVAVVHENIQDRNDRVELAALDAAALQLFDKGARDKADAAHIIIKNADLDTVGGALGEDVLQPPARRPAQLPAGLFDVRHQDGGISGPPPAHVRRNIPARDAPGRFDDLADGIPVSAAQIEHAAPALPL